MLAIIPPQPSSASSGWAANTSISKFIIYKSGSYLYWNLIDRCPYTDLCMIQDKYIIYNTI